MPSDQAGIVRWHFSMSLDGFIAGPEHSMDWIFQYSSEPNPVVDRVISSTGAILAGRRSYDVGRRDTGKPSGEAFGGGWAGPQFVLTHRPPEDDPDPSLTFLSGPIGPVVDRARTAAAGKDLLVIGADVARQCIDAGLIDEILIHVAPVLLGDGVRWYGGPGFRRVEVEPMPVESAGRIANLRYRVTGA